MKTEQQVRDKLKECEKFIKKAIKEKNNDLQDLVYMSASRDIMRWVLAEDLIKRDKMNKDLDFEILCIESVKLF